VRNVSEERVYVLWFKECTSESLPKVGGKNASLGEMTKAGIPVPPGFAVTTEAYEDFLTDAGIKGNIERALSQVDIQDVASVDKASQTIRQLIESAPVPQRISEAISNAYQTLAKECNVADLPIAVRSSATAEDLPGASFAGQQETFLWVKGPDETLQRFKTCISSLFTPRAISYRIKMGFPHEKVLISVGMQKMVNARAAGVMFTLNPISGDRSKIVIEANWGLGETVVAGEVTPDWYLVDKVAFEILRRGISCKTTECVVDPDTGHAVYRDIPPERQNIPCISDEEIMELTRLGRLIERHYGTPQDIEWSIDNDLPFPENILIVQSRPETVWSQKKREEPLFKPKASVMEMMIEQLKEGRRLR
jgi:pyruvate,water dikinase